MRLSLNMVVCNEEPHMRAALSDLRPYVDEIVVVVQPSEDRTLELAYELADIVIEHPAYRFAEPSRPAALAACTGDWAMVMDADERLSAYGKAHLREWVNDPNYDYYNWRRLTRLSDGRVLEDCPHPRLYRRGFVATPTQLHAAYYPINGARVRTISSEVVIEHFKQVSEQRLDDLRYAELMKGAQG